MANVKFLFNDVVSSSFIYAENTSNEVSTLPASNLKVSGRTKVYRSIGAEALKFHAIVNFPANSEVEDIFLLRTNVQTTANLQVLFRDEVDAIISNATYPMLATGVSDFVPDNRSTHIVIPNTVAKTMEITIDDTTNPDGFLQASRLFAGVSYSTKINAEYGMDFGWEEDTSPYRSMGGTLYSDNKTPYRYVNMRLPELTKDEMITLMNYVQYVGKRRDFVVSVYPEDDPWLDQAFTFSCRFKSMPKFEQFSYDRWRVNFNLVEV